MVGKRMPVLILTILSICFIFYGCGQDKPVSGGGKIIIKINKYEMTSEEFLQEARLAMPGKYLPIDTDKAKTEILDEIITKEILLQEAQRQNLDKNKAFRKEIERYWEQALLKSLIRAKIEELSKGVIIQDAEIKREYDRMFKESPAAIKPLEKMAPEIRSELKQMKVRESLDKWMKSLRGKANIKIYKENLKSLEIK